MQTKEIGMRVFAVMSATDKEVTLFGKGKYLGDRPLTEADQNARGPFGLPIASILEVDPEHKNPCIELDDGNVVWGFECWWGPEDVFDGWVNGRTVVTVDINEARKAN